METQFFHLLICSPDLQQQPGPGLARAKGQQLHSRWQGPKESSTAFSGILAGTWIGREPARTHISTLMVIVSDCRCCKQPLNLLCHSADSLYVLFNMKDASFYPEVSNSYWSKLGHLVLSLQFQII